MFLNINPLLKINLVKVNHQRENNLDKVSLKSKISSSKTDLKKTIVDIFLFFNLKVRLIIQIKILIRNEILPCQFLSDTAQAFGGDAKI